MSGHNVNLYASVDGNTFTIRNPESSNYQITNYGDMFKGTSENITICYKSDNSNNNGILNQIMDISNNNIINCSVDFFFED